MVLVMSKQNIEDIIYDRAADAAYHAKNENVASAAVNNILEVITQIEDPITAIKTTILFILRQNSRGIIKSRTARSLVNTLKEILESDFESKREIATRFLGLFKWAYEATNSYNYRPERNLNIVDFKKFLSFFR